MRRWRRPTEARHANPPRPFTFTWGDVARLWTSIVVAVAIGIVSALTTVR